jgi:hypothetical protein
MKCILTPNPEIPYNLRQISPAYGDSSFANLSEDEILQRVIDRHKEVGIIPADASYWVVDTSELPDDDFFDAWEWDDGATINMPKARGIQMDKIREVRNKELAKKDIEFMKALEADDGSHKAIATEKQVLRDIPQTFDLTTDTSEELKQKWPEGLPKE